MILGLQNLSPSRFNRIVSILQELVNTGACPIPDFPYTKHQVRNCYLPGYNKNNFKLIMYVKSYNDQFAERKKLNSLLIN